MTAPLFFLAAIMTSRQVQPPIHYVARLIKVSGGAITVHRRSPVAKPRTITVKATYDPKKAAVALYGEDTITPTGSGVSFKVYHCSDQTTATYTEETTLENGHGDPAPRILGTRQGVSEAVLIPWTGSVLRLQRLFVLAPDRLGAMTSVSVVYTSRGNRKIELAEPVPIAKISKFGGVTKYDLALSASRLKEMVLSNFPAAIVKTDEEAWLSSQLIKKHHGVSVVLHLVFAPTTTIDVQAFLKDSDVDDASPLLSLDDLSAESDGCETLRKNAEACEFGEVLWKAVQQMSPDGNYFWDVFNLFLEQHLTN